MTNQEFHGESSQQTQPHQPQPSMPVPPGYGGATQTLQPEAPKGKKQSNVVGLIALIAAALGFIFACIPGALIVGWILLPIAFILALVSLFLKGKSKWMGLTALILSIVGTIVGVVVFLGVVATSVDEAFGSGDTTVVEPSDDAAVETDATAEEESATEVGTRENPYPIGSVIESEDWRIVVNSVTLAATDAVLAAVEYNEPPAAGSEYILVNYSATYLGDDPNGQMPGFVPVEYVTADGTTINTYDTVAVAPDRIDATSTLYTDATATGNVAFAVPSATAGQGVLAITPDFLSDKIFVAVQ